MMEMNLAREKKLDTNRRIILEVELKVVSLIKDARTKLSGVNPFKHAKTLIVSEEK